MNASWSAASERNKAPILARLEYLLRENRRILEIGSGTGQHAVHFSASMPWLRWICSDVEQREDGIRAMLAAHPVADVEGPLVLDVTARWPDVAFDGVFSANTLHILPWPAVEAFIDNASARLPRGGRLIIYGPFHYAGTATSTGNAAFDVELHARGGGEGIRDIEDVHALAAVHGLRFLADCALPANNRLLCWEKTA